jgi:O-antigen/teichoic acid export membrane protein
MRVKNSFFNITVGLGNQLIITILSLVSRTVFIHTLGIEYLGVNGLFTSMLAMLTLAEAGIGSSIIYNLYKPVADNDRPKILALMQLYVFVKDTSVEHLTIIYLLFLLNTAAPYLFVYKNSFLNVNQKNYIVTAVFSVSAIVSTCMKIAILYYTENYLLYLALESFISIVTSIVLALVVDRMYPFLKEKTKLRLDPETKANFIRNMKAIILQNVGNYFIFGVDSILISTFVSIAAVGLYSNYKMLIDICRTFLNQIFSGMYHSLGNLVAKEKADSVYRIFKVTYLLNFWLYSLLAIGLYLLTEPLITLWLGSSFTMTNTVLLLLVLAFYERGMRNSLSAVKTTAGIFHEDRYAPIVQAAVNLGISFALAQVWGIAGIFAGSLISALLVPFWYTPLLVYRKVFQVPLRHYYYRYVGYTALGVAACVGVGLLERLLPSGSIMWLFVKGVLCVVLVNGLYAACFFKTEEFGYLKSAGGHLLGKLPVAARLAKRLPGRKQAASG